MDSRDFLNNLLGGMSGMHSSGSAGSYTGQSYNPPTDSRERSTDLSLLEDRVERLTLVCIAMWSLLQDKTNLTEEDLNARVKMLDLMDGQADGKASRTVQRCDACDRPMSMRHRKCLYCGHEKLHTSAFDAV